MKRTTTAARLAKGDEIGLSWHGREYLRSQVRAVIPHRFGTAWIHTSDGRAVLLAKELPVTIYQHAA